MCVCGGYSAQDGVKVWDLRKVAKQVAPPLPPPRAARRGFEDAGREGAPPPPATGGWEDAVMWESIAADAAIATPQSPVATANAAISWSPLMRP